MRSSRDAISRSTSCRSQPRFAIHDPGPLVSLLPELTLGRRRLEMLYWGENHHRCSDTIAHEHLFHEMCFVTQGRGALRTGKTSHGVQQGDLFVARPGVLHAIESSARQRMGIVFWAFQIKPADRQALSDEWSVDVVTGFEQSARTLTSRVWQVDGILQLLMEELAQPRPGQGRAATSLIELLMIHAMRALTDRSVPMAPEIQHAGDMDTIRVRMAQRFIHDNLHRPIGVDDIARQLHLSQRQARRIFLKVTGMGLHDWLVAQRMKHAATLLRRHPDWPIKQVALQCGYVDAAAFSTRFRKTMGWSPAGFARR